MTSPHPRNSVEKTASINEWQVAKAVCPFTENMQKFREHGDVAQRYFQVAFISQNYFQYHFYCIILFKWKKNWQFHKWCALKSISSFWGCIHWIALVHKPESVYSYYSYIHLNLDFHIRSGIDTKGASATCHLARQRLRFSCSCVVFPTQLWKHLPVWKPTWDKAYSHHKGWDGTIKK